MADFTTTHLPGRRRPGTGVIPLDTSHGSSERKTEVDRAQEYDRALRQSQLAARRRGGSMLGRVHSGCPKDLRDRRYSKDYRLLRRQYLGIRRVAYRPRRSMRCRRLRIVIWLRMEVLVVGWVSRMSMARNGHEHSGKQRRGGWIRRWRCLGTAGTDFTTGETAPTRVL